MVRNRGSRYPLEVTIYMQIHGEGLKDLRNDFSLLKASAQKLSVYLALHQHWEARCRPESLEIFSLWKLVETQTFDLWSAG